MNEMASWVTGGAVVQLSLIFERLPCLHGNLLSWDK